MDLQLGGKRAVVLAASRGLGFACAQGLAREGCDLVICSRDASRIEDAAARIRTETGARVVAEVADVGRAEMADALVRRAVDELGGLEIVVHNAGGPPAGDSASITDEQWLRAFEANLMSFVRLARAAVPHMKAAGYGRILAITSTSIRQPIPNLVLSNSLRTGVYGFAKTLSREVASAGILVNLIAPGRILTERLDELDGANAARTGKSVQDVRQASIAAIPIGRLGRPEELANLAVFLASPLASYITGTAIAVDGGSTGSL